MISSGVLMNKVNIFSPCHPGNIAALRAILADTSLSATTTTYLLRFLDNLFGKTVKVRKSHRPRGGKQGIRNEKVQ
jgi:hypothetical protein